MKETKPQIEFIQGILNSYSQVFFSNSRIFAWFLLVVTFFDLVSGLAGLLAVIVANGLAWLAGYNKEKIAKGYYGFNSLLVGLGLGLFFRLSPEFLLILAFGSVMTLFLTITLENVIGKYGLPYLSIPFIAGIWLILLASRQYQYLEISERGIYNMNEMYVLGGMTMVRIYDWFNHIPLPQSVIVYFRSLGAIFFQYHLFPGLIIAAGLLIYSRIAFLLSVFGFYAAYVFYQMVGADLTTLHYTYIGFNFILTAIAIGGFFIIPSWYSFLWVLLLTPVTSILLTSTSALFAPFQLSIYSLPFNMVVLLFLYALKFRERNFNKPDLVYLQQFSPERNLYSQINNRSRFGPYSAYRFGLPFWGEWIVTQGHNGEHTHQENWKEAWDFEIADENGKTYKGEGNAPGDYFCYDKPVLATADGWIEKVVNEVEDNPIGKMNLERNWGNTVIIRHGEKVYSAISHLKKDSIKVKAGDFVKKGEVLGNCGNSGRSPAPHLHFQFQSTPQLGSKTADIPLARYVSIHPDQDVFRTFDRPKEMETVMNIEPVVAIQTAFNFAPGQQMVINIKDDTPGGHRKITWEVKADIYNNTYLYCTESHARAYFKWESDVFYFTHFEGKRSSPLYTFYLSAYHIIFNKYRKLKTKNPLPTGTAMHGIWKFAQDFLAPFYIIIQTAHTMEFEKSGNHFMDDVFKIRSMVNIRAGKRTLRQINFEISLKDSQLESISRTENGKEQLKLTWERKSS